MDSRILLRAAGLAVAALAGAALALGGAAVMNVGGETTTVREVVSSPSSAAPAFKGEALSISDIYQQSAPGVVQGRHSARNRLVSPRARAPRLDENASQRPSGENIGKPSKVGSRVTATGSPPWRSTR